MTINNNNTLTHAQQTNLGNPSLNENRSHSSFDIRDHLDQLTEDGGSASKGWESFQCPACQAPNFKVEMKTGRYITGSCACATTEQGKKQIRDTVAPPQYQAKEEDHEQREYDPVDPAKVTLAQFPEGYKPKLANVEKIDDNLIKTTYRYSPTQLIVREDYPLGKQKLDKDGNPKLDEAGNPALYYKKFSYYTKDNNGNWSYKKGDRHWEAYNLEEAIAQGYNGYILVVEGEKATDKARERLGIPAITFRGWNEEGIKPSLTQLKNSGIAGIIMFPDNDSTGEKDAKEVAKWCDQLEFPYYKLSPTDVWGDMPEKGDIVDWVESQDYQDMIRPNLIQELEEAIHKAVDSKNRNEAKAEKKRQAQQTDYYVADDPIDLKVAENTFAEDWMVVNEVFYQYQENKGYWQKVPNDKVKRHISHELKNYFTVKETKDGEIKKIYKFAKDSNVKSCFSFAKGFLTLSHDPANNHLLSLKNGTVDLRTGELGSHKKDNYLTRHIPLDYKKSDKIPPLFHEFLSYSYGEEQIPLIRAVMSMFVDPTAPYGKAVHLIGKSGTGKGFLTRVIKELVGIDNVGSIDKFSLIADQDKRHQNLTARSLIVAPDISGYLSDLGAFYELVDNGSMSGRALHSNDGYEKVWNLRFLLASVQPLQVENAGEGWKRRIIPIPTLGRQGKSQTENLENRVRQEELAHILGWALSMPREERDSMLFNSNLWAKANRDLQFEQDTHSDTVRAFIDQCLTPSDKEHDSIDTNVLYGYYKAFTQITGGKQKSQTNFVAGLKNALEELYQKGKSYRENGKYKKTKPKFTNMTLTARFHPDNFDGFTYTCDPRTLSTGGYEEFMDFLSPESVALTDECDPDSEKVNATPETPTTEETEQGRDPVTLCPSEKYKNSTQDDSLAFTSSSLEKEGNNNNKEGKSQSHKVTKDTEAQKPDNEKVSGVTVTQKQAKVTEEATVTKLTKDMVKPLTADHIKKAGELDKQQYFKVFELMKQHKAVTTVEAVYEALKPYDAGLTPEKVKRHIKAISYSTVQDDGLCWLPDIY